MFRLGPYELVREIAVGGMAEVHLAKVTGIGGFEKYVALKTIHPQFAEDARFVDLLVNEAKIAVQLVHPNIAQTFDLGRVDDTYYMSMEYVDGIDVWRLLIAAQANGMRMPIDACTFIARDVALALDHAHSRCDTSGNPLGVVHRDVSPQNVMITWEGTVKLVDFGIAKAANSIRHTNAGTITGKLQYLSPEQAWGEELDGRSDIFSAGIVLYEMLTGRPIYVEPDPGLLVEMARAGVVAPPSTLRPDIPSRLEAIVMRALTADKAQRYQQAGELAHDLQGFLRVNSPRYVAASLAKLIEGLFRPASPAAAPVPEPKSEYISLRALTEEEVAHAGDAFLDQNSVLVPHEEINLDQNSSLLLGADTIFDRSSVAVVVDKPRAATEHDAAPPPAVPDELAKYEVHERLGWSVLATVHRATLTTKTGPREVALKRLAPQLADDAMFCERFVDEMTRVSRVEHRNLVKIVDFGRADRVHFVATELVTGVSLRKLLLRSQPAPVVIVLKIISQLVDALVAAHTCAVHGSVTPSNLIVGPTGAVKLTDLGVAHALWGMAPHAIAKLGYLAPEAAMGAEMDPRADVFSVGVIAWELLVGRRLFDGGTPRAILQQLRTLKIAPPSRYNEHCDSSIDRIVLGTLMKHDERTASAVALRAALQPFSEHFEGKLDDVARWAHVESNVRPVVPELEFELAIGDAPASDIDANVGEPEAAQDPVLDDSKVIVIDGSGDDG